MRTKYQESWLRRTWSWQREADKMDNAFYLLCALLEARKKKSFAAHVHTYNLPRFITGNMVKEKFDHKQWDTWHKIVIKLIPTVNRNLYSAVKVTVTKIAMKFHFILFLRSCAHYDSSAFLVKAKISPSRQRLTFAPAVLSMAKVSKVVPITPN